MSDTKQKIRDILEEMFGPERAAAITFNGKPWQAEFEKIGAKNIDRIDFECFVREKFDIKLQAQFFVDLAFAALSIDEIARYVDATTPSDNPY